MTRRLTCLALVAACHAPGGVERPTALPGDEVVAAEVRDDRGAFALFSIRHIEPSDGRACLEPLACRGAIDAPISLGDTCPISIELDARLRTEELASIKRRPGNRCGYELVDPELYTHAARGRFAVWPPAWGLDRRLNVAVVSRDPVAAHQQGAIVAAMQRAVGDGRLVVLRDRPGQRDEGTRVASPSFARRYVMPTGTRLEVVDAVAVNESLGNGVVRALVVVPPDLQPHVAYDLGAEMIVAEPEAITVEDGLDLLRITTATAASNCDFERVLRFDGRAATALATTHVQCR